jgi:hypothetical protein
MPATFTGRLSYAGNSDGKYRILDGGITALIELFPTLAESGDIEYLTLEGGILYYQPIPTVAVSITCIGYKLPDTLVNDADTPSFIPSYLHRETIVNKAAQIIFTRIEDGIDVDKVNTKVYEGLYNIGLNKYKAYISRRRPVNAQSNWDY